MIASFPLKEEELEPRILYLTGDMTNLSIHLFKVRWNDHLVNYLTLMYRYGINTNIFYLTFSRAKF